MSSTAPQTLASHLELSRAAVAHNVTSFRQVVGPSRRVGGVLKGNAYGHGLDAMLELAHGLLDAFYVIRPEEALRVRAFEQRTGAPRRDVIVLGAVTPDEVVELTRAHIDVVAADGSFAAAAAPLRAAGLRARVHVHLDTGLGREGFTPQQLEAGEADFFGAATDAFELHAVLSHFSNTEDVTEQEYALEQLSRFDAGETLFRQHAHHTGRLQRHFAASAAALVLPAARFDVVRAGISLYGVWPSPETRLSARVVMGPTAPELHPVLSWRCRSQLVKWLKAGSYVGYGCTHRCRADTRVAVLPVGYWDGYPRLASGKAYVLVNGERCPVLGRVMMNHLIVDVTHAVRDEAPLMATLLGHDGHEALSVETIASWAQTISYETLTRLGPHLERRLVD